MTIETTNFDQIHCICLVARVCKCYSVFVLLLLLNICVGLVASIPIPCGIPPPMMSGSASLEPYYFRGRRGLGSQARRVAIRCCERHRRHAVARAILHRGAPHPLRHGLRSYCRAALLGSRPSAASPASASHTFSTSGCCGGGCGVACSAAKCPLMGSIPLDASTVHLSAESSQRGSLACQAAKCPLKGTIPPDASTVHLSAGSSLMGSIPPDASMVRPSAENSQMGSVACQAALCPLMGSIPPDVSTVRLSAEISLMGSIFPDASWVRPSAENSQMGSMACQAALCPLMGSIPLEALTVHLSTESSQRGSVACQAAICPLKGSIPPDASTVRLTAGSLLMGSIPPDASMVRSSAESLQMGSVACHAAKCPLMGSIPLDASTVRSSAESFQIGSVACQAAICPLTSSIPSNASTVRLSADTPQISSIPPDASTMRRSAENSQSGSVACHAPKGVTLYGSEALHNEDNSWDKSRARTSQHSRAPPFAHWLDCTTGLSASWMDIISTSGLNISSVFSSVGTESMVSQMLLDHNRTSGAAVLQLRHTCTFEIVQSAREVLRLSSDCSLFGDLCAL